MLKFILDNIVKEGTKIIAYVNVLDGTNIIKSVCLPYKNEEDFKSVLLTKTANVKAEYDEKEANKTEIEKILEVM